MFHRPHNAVVPTVLPVDISLLEIKSFLIFIRDVMSQGKHFESRTLRRLGPPCSGSDIQPRAAVRGKSQANVPTSAIVSPARDSVKSGGWLETDGKIMVPDLREANGYDFQDLNRSAIKLGRFIEHPDRPSGEYYDSELPAYCEGAVWDPSADWLAIRPRSQKGSSFCHLLTRGIKFYWSMGSHRELDPIVAKLSEKKLLMEWIDGRKVAFLIIAYQTHVNARIEVIDDDDMRLDKNLSLRRVEKYVEFPGEMISAICLREVKVVQSSDGEATLEFGNDFWRVYWGIVDKEANRPTSPASFSSSNVSEAKVPTSPASLSSLNLSEASPRSMSAQHSSSQPSIIEQRSTPLPSAHLPSRLNFYRRTLAGLRSRLGSSRITPREPIEERVMPTLTSTADQMRVLAEA